MGALEIVLLLAGGILAVLGFVLPASKDDVPQETKKLAKEEIKSLVGQEMSNIRQHVDDVVGESIEYAVEKTERSLERLTNEKIMAVNEYSDTVLEDIHKNHEEAMFLYDMLNDKHTSLKNMMAEINKTVQEAEEVRRGTAAAAGSFQQIRPGISGIQAGNESAATAQEPLTGLKRLSQAAAAERAAAERAAAEKAAAERAAIERAAAEKAAAEAAKRAAAEKAAAKKAAAEAAERAAAEKAAAEKAAAEAAERAAAEKAAAEKAVAEAAERAAAEKAAAEKAAAEAAEKAAAEIAAEPPITAASVSEPVTDLYFMTAGEENTANNNERILSLYQQGKSKVAIARELGLGVGEVKLVIDLYNSH